MPEQVESTHLHAADGAATDVDAQAFSRLPAAEQARLLKAYVNVGITRFQLNDHAGALKEYAAVARLGEPVFAQINADARGQVLIARFHAGGARGQLNDPAGALSEYAAVARLGEPVFTELDADGRRQVLFARVDAGFARQQLNDAAGELTEYAAVASLVEPVFTELDADGRGELLRARVNAGFRRGQLNSPTEGLIEYAAVARLGEPVFTELEADGRRQVLTARVNAGNTRGQLKDPARALAEYAAVARLGEPVFTELDADGRRQVLMARVNAGATCDQLNDHAGELTEYAAVAHLGEPVFTELTAAGRRWALVARVNAGNTRGQLNDPAGAQAEFIAVALLCEPVFAELDADGRRQVLRARVNAGVSTRWRGSAGQQSLLRALWIAPAIAKLEAAVQSSSTYELPRAAAGTWGTQTVAETARWWLGRMAAFPARPDHPLQLGLAHALGIGLAHTDLHALRHPHRAWLASAVAGEGAAGKLPISRLLARAALTQTLTALDLADLSARDDAMVLARVRAVVGSTEGWPESAPWRTDAAALARQVKVADLWPPDGTQRPTYTWLTQANVPRLEFVRFGISAKATSGPLLDALHAWNKGDASAAVSLLNSAWGMAQAPAQKIGVQLQAWGVPQPQSQTMALDAAIYGDWAKVLEDACAVWIESILKAVAVGGTKSLNLAVGAVLHSLALPNPDKVLRQKVHELAGLNLAARTAEDRWRLLETGRFALASAVADKVTPLPDDEKTAERLQSAVAAEQAALAIRLDRVNAGKPDIHPDPERQDITFGVFEALHDEMRRLKRLPQFPDSAACAAELSPGEHLVQLHFDKGGVVHALALSHGAALREAALLGVPTAPAWQGLVAAWKSTAFSSLNWCFPQGDVDAGIERKQRALALTAWQQFVAVDSPATQLLTALRTLLGGNQNLSCHLILPAELARLPWLARAVSGTDPERGDFEPGEFTLEASVSTWLQTRRAASAAPKSASPPGPSQAAALHSPVKNAERLEGDALAHFESLLVARRLGTTAQVAGGLIEVVRALQAPGPAHLVMHGKFGPGDAGADDKAMDGLYLVNHGSEAEPDIETKLPAWLIGAVAVQGDISLASCEAMLATPAWGDAMGPVGIGPMLRASGAASVTGPLGRSNQLASMMFYDLWYEARQQHAGLQALAVAQQRLRTMTAKEAVERLAVLPPALRQQALQHLLNADDTQHPMAHPALWAQFTMLGEAAVLPARAKAKDPGLLARALSWLKAVFSRGTARA